MARAYRRCSRCGRGLNTAYEVDDTIQFAPEGIASDTVATPPASVSPCSVANPISAQLYGVTFDPEVFVECCDPICGCKQYNIRERNTFWPGFAHPRWLSCEELYKRQVP